MNRRLRSMSRREYLNLLSSIPTGECLYCKAKTYQIIIKSWRHWFFVQSISPYFPYHTMLVPVRHVRSLNQLNDRERTEFWRVESLVTMAYDRLGVKRVRALFHIRKKNKTRKYRINEHFHIHFFEFQESDMDTLIHKDIYKQRFFMKMKRVVNKLDQKSL